MRRLAPPLATALVLAGALDVAASPVVDFARCLARRGAIYFTAQWCPHCARQNAMFGSGVRHLRIVDCSAGCPGVQVLPTWRFADGSTKAGVASFEELGRRTGCALATEREKAPADRDGGGPGRERYEAGAKIIDLR